MRGLIYFLLSVSVVCLALIRHRTEFIQSPSDAFHTINTLTQMQQKLMKSNIYPMIFKA